MTAAVVSVGHRALRQHVRKVGAGDLLSPEFLACVARMRRHLLRSSHAVGLAANQINEPFSVFAAQVKESFLGDSRAERAQHEQRGVRTMPLRFFVNPRVMPAALVPRSFSFSPPTMCSPDDKAAVSNSRSDQQRGPTSSLQSSLFASSSQPSSLLSALTFKKTPSEAASKSSAETAPTPDVALARGDDGCVFDASAYLASLPPPCCEAVRNIQESYARYLETLFASDVADGHGAHEPMSNCVRAPFPCDRRKSATTTAEAPESKASMTKMQPDEQRSDRQSQLTLQENLRDCIRTGRGSSSGSKGYPMVAKRDPGEEEKQEVEKAAEREAGLKIGIKSDANEIDIIDTYAQCQVTWDFESCLSVMDGDLGAAVPRWRHVVIESQDLNGQQIIETMSDYHSRIIQHESDHLHGQLFLDHMIPGTATEPNNVGHQTDHPLDESKWLHGPMIRPFSNLAAANDIHAQVCCTSSSGGDSHRSIVVHGHSSKKN